MLNINRTSLHGFSKSHNLAKSSVSRKAKELGIDTANGLTDEDCDRLKAVFNVPETALVLASNGLKQDSEQALEQSQDVGKLALSTRGFLATVETEEIPIFETLKHVPSTDSQESTKSKLDMILGQSAQFQNSAIQELLSQTLADGEELGVLMGQIKIAAAKRKENEILGDFVKKQGLAAE